MSRTPTSSDSSESSSSETSTFTPETLITTRTSVIFSATSSESISVAPVTSDGTTGFTTITTVVVASSAVGTLTEASSYTTTPTALAGSDNAGGSSGLSSGAKTGIGVGVGLAVVIAAAFGFWFSWYQRKKRKRNSLAESDHYPPSSLPAMTYGSGGRDYGAGSALAGGVGYTERSETRSELPSPPLGSPDPLLGGLGGRAPDRLAPAAAGPISWGSNSNQGPHSNQSVSDYSDYNGQQAAAAAVGAGAGAGAAAGYYPGSGQDAHELPENQQAHAYGGARTLSNGSQNLHQRNVSGSSQQGQYGGTVSPQTAHSRTMSDSSSHAHPYHMSMGSDNPYAAELHSTPATSNQGAELEANLQQRMDFERKPVRQGHFLTKSKGDIDPSQNF
ncbi:uncharacterized protein HMPREF1541_04647 [Cyphellophora europaea CBS 101466]|uniref:Mid2 domain-containing protein n=1 Tax=Cyphellophora europaea (strain CBS 101466) TaxID=1220924 RepID=W2RVQ1_CYPE1|nr:uncharacterized protein HMPREF1541_04647 [Cyphellophora europaea CBS 101466]ETN40370.1 hypothetical protein HMPREF1541_04647 [Cyphellophora europaea CBS 101466]